MRKISYTSVLTLLLSLMSVALQAQTLTGLQLWLKPEGLTNTVASSPIVSWTDSSVNGYHATNTSGTQRPTYTPATLNGYPVAHFTGDGLVSANLNWLHSPLPFNSAYTNFTAIIVYKTTYPAAATARCQLMHQQVGFANLYIAASATTTNLKTDAANSTGAGTPITTGTWKIATVVEDATSVKVYENGVLLETKAIGTVVATTSTGWVFGARQDKTRFGLNGDVAEVLVYNTNLSPAQLWATQDYLAAKYTNSVAIANLQDAYAVSTGEWTNNNTWSTSGNIVSPADVFMSSNGVAVTISDGGTYSVVGNKKGNIDLCIGRGDNLYNGIVDFGYGDGTVWDHKGPFGNGQLNISSGSLTTGGRIFGVGFRAGSTGTLNLSGTGSLTVTNIDFFAGWDGANGVIALTNSAALNLKTTSGNNRIGWGSVVAATMNYNQSGGTLTATNFLYFGGAGSGLTTTANLSGGAIVSYGDMLVGHNDALSTTFNQSGSSTVNVATGKQLYLGNLSATAAYNLSGGSLTCNGSLILAPNGTSAIGTFTQSGGTATLGELDLGTTGGVNGRAVCNLNGGTLGVFGIVAYSGIQAGSGIFLGGGTLKALGNQTWSTALRGVNGTTSTIDAQTFAVTASQISTNTVGASFTVNKTGAGTLTLDGSVNNSGLALNVQIGTTALAKTSSASVHAASSVTVQSGAIAQLGGTGGDQIDNSATVSLLGTGKLDMNGRNETVTALVIAGTTKAAGTWGATGSGAAHIDNTHFQGTGILTVTSGPVTTLTLTTTTNPSQFGASVTFTATIKTNAVTAANASGDVIFSLNATPVSTNALSGGAASYTTSGLPAGTNTITASYAGDDNYAGSANSLSQVVNRPPVAQSFTSSIANGDLLTMVVIGGKFSPTDPDGDTMTVSAVSSAIIGGGVPATNGGSGFTYSTTGAVVGTNTFTYTVSDGRGGTDTKTVTVLVTAASGGANITGLSVSGSDIVVSALGIPGATYSLQYTDSLSPVSWQDALVTNIASGVGLISLTNNPATLPPVRYYRTKYVSGP